MAKTLRIDGKRLYFSLAELGKIGAYKDEGADIVGVNRLALTAADGEGRRLVMKWFRQAGLRVTINRIGNVYGRRAGREDKLPPVMLGSHIDSVPTAGRFDGTFAPKGYPSAVGTALTTYGVGGDFYIARNICLSFGVNSWQNPTSLRVGDQTNALGITDTLGANLGVGSSF